MIFYLTDAKSLVRRSFVVLCVIRQIFIFELVVYDFPSDFRKVFYSEWQKIKFLLLIAKLAEFLLHIQFYGINHSIINFVLWFQTSDKRSNWAFLFLKFQRKRSPLTFQTFFGVIMYNLREQKLLMSRNLNGNWSFHDDEKFCARFSVIKSKVAYFLFNDSELWDHFVEGCLSVEEL